MIGRKSYHDMILETAGLLSYWNFGAGTGSKVWDQKGILHGDITGATWVQKANGLWTLSFDGTNDKIAATGVTITNYSVECWYKPDVITGTKTIIEQGNFILRQVTAGIEYGFITNEFWEVTNTVSGILTAGTWYFITLTKEGSVVKLYLNSVLVGSFTDATTQGTALGLTMAVSDRTNFPMLALTPANLTAKKGISITRQDNLQYTRGSLQGGDGSGVVYECIPTYQGAVEAWVRNNLSSVDTNDRYVIGSGNIKLYWDGVNTRWKAIVNGITITLSDTFAAGDWVYLLLNWDTTGATDTLNLTVDGNAASQVTTAQTVGTPSSAFYVGQDSTPAYRFNGVIAGRILQKTISTNYAAGAGSIDSFVVTPDTVWLGTYSDGDTDAISWHRGQQVTAITNTATESALTLGQAVGSRSWKDNDRVAIWDGTGYKKEGLIDEASIATTDTSLDVDNGSGALVTDLEKVGRSLDFDALRYAQAANNTIHDITTQDIGASAWIRADSGSQDSYQTILIKRVEGAAVYWFRLYQGRVQGNISDGIDGYIIEGNTDIRDNKWHHVAFIIDRNNAANSKVFLDGFEDGATIKTGTVTLVDSLSNTGTFTIGKDNTATVFNFDGQIRDVILAYPADIMAANEMGASGEILTLATTPRDLTTVNSEDSWALNDNAATTVVVGAVNNLTASANTSTFTTQEAFISKSLLCDGNMEN